jgi:hypothetical protein
MKRMRSLILATCALVALGVAAQAKTQSCCEKAIAEGKKCTHPCCEAAAKEGNVCDKCNKDCMPCCKEAIKAGKVCEKCNPPKK